MTWLWIGLALVGLLMIVVLGLLVQLLRRTSQSDSSQAVMAANLHDEQHRRELAERDERHRAALAEREDLHRAELLMRDERHEATVAGLREAVERLQNQAAEGDRELRALGRERSQLEEQLSADRARHDSVLAQQRLEQEETRRQFQDAQHVAELAEGQLQQEREELAQLRATLDTREVRLGEREQRLLAESQSLEARSTQLVELRAQAQEWQDRAQEELVEARREREMGGVQLQTKLERVAGLDVAQARAEMMARVEHESRLEATALARDIEQTARRDAEARARGIIVTAIQRLAAEQTSESVVSTLDLPSDEMKGRIIGREGRNIRHFEQVTGVNVMIDDTPGSVLLSCFDPVRREIARITLAELVADGRIHPARIEEVHERSRQRIEDKILRAAEDALAEVGISDLDPALLPIVGALRYRTSYGQNVLRHLVECAHIAGMMAAELGLDVAVCKRAAFLHDIGKALTHEVEGTHAMVGAELARRHGESPDIVHAIEAHHNEVEPSTVEAVLTQAADAISGSRPGARRESLEAYVQRLDRLEEIAAAHEGVDKVFAMQAGREVRVMVSPDHVDDNASHALARDIAHEIQEELTYPGQIRVTVVRESRATEVAH
ncbi:ribonuclease Y [Luteococcus sp. Sow4_B9]|uniref:ribonuclease Y n=1 Tax=Luteococcus sp. Sow4_B9 TaxID=3438792 RepID=UPI003F988FDB